MGNKKDIRFAWVRLPYSSGVHLATQNADKIHHPIPVGKDCTPYSLLFSRDNLQCDARIIGLYWARPMGTRIRVYPVWADSPAESAGLKFTFLENLLSILFANFPEAEGADLNLWTAEDLRIDRSVMDQDRKAWAKHAVMCLAREAGKRQRKTKAALPSRKPLQDRLQENRFTVVPVLPGALRMTGSAHQIGA